MFCVSIFFPTIQASLQSPPLASSLSSSSGWLGGGAGAVSGSGLLSRSASPSKCAGFVRPAAASSFSACATACSIKLSTAPFFFTRRRGVDASEVDGDAVALVGAEPSSLGACSAVALSFFFVLRRPLDDVGGGDSGTGGRSTATTLSPLSAGGTEAAAALALAVVVAVTGALAEDAARGDNKERGDSS